MIGRSLSRYEILDELGKGGMGEVYLARDPSLDRRIALKILPPQMAADPLRRERFEREARTVAALKHPNIVTIYSVEESEGVHFLTMELVEGPTLDRLIPADGLPLERFFDLAVPMADALRAAHQKQIIHRDLKPTNVMVDDEERVKVLDFGLAKLQPDTAVPEASQVATEALTQQGLVMGTIPYMSPEQLESGPVDQRSDIFSLGIVLYEMATGRRPFQGDSGPALTSSILRDTPPSVSEARAELPRHLGRIIGHCLEKDPNKRFQTARDVHNELVGLREELRSGVEIASEPEPYSAPGRRFGRKAWIAAAGTLTLLLVGTALWLPFSSRRNLERARALIPEMEGLAEAGGYAAAYDLALEIEKQLPDDPVLARWLAEVADTLTVTTEPEGAEVYLQRMPSEPGESPERVLVGSTPLVDLRIPRTDHFVWLEKEGYVTLERLVSSALNRAEGLVGVEPEIVLEAALTRDGAVPDDMLGIAGGEYKLRGSDLGGMETIELDDFLIDRYEVSNEEYLEFIHAGGYSEPAYWKHAFPGYEAEFPIADAMRRFQDRTGLPGPREWSSQEFPAGKGDHPVTSVSWYEAAAYCEYAGKALPTIYQWEKAARDGRWTHFENVVMPWGLSHLGVPTTQRANFMGRDTVPVDSYPFGISPWGAYNMAGNVSEWSVNTLRDGRATAGGSWADAVYQFSLGTQTLGAFYAADTVGFRCVSKPAPGAADQGSGRIQVAEAAAVGTPVDDATYGSFLTHYRYDRQPLDPELIETVETPDWTRQKLTLAGPSDDRIIAYLYLPKSATPPYQCISYWVSAAVWYTRTAAEEVEVLLAPQIKAGRAVLAIVPSGMIERQVPGHTGAQGGSVQSRDEAVGHVAEFRIGLDYLESREEIDMGRIAHVGFSYGAVGHALVFLAIEPRIRSSVLIGGALWLGRVDALPEADAVNFVPRIRAPTLVLHGRYDEENPYEPYTRSLFDLLQAPKRLELVESGHLPPLEIRTPIINEFLDETLGPVER